VSTDDLLRAAVGSDIIATLEALRPDKKNMKKKKRKKKSDEIDTTLKILS